MIGADPFFTGQQEQLGKLVSRHAVPAVYENREFTKAGGLMSYGGDFTDAYRLVGVYAVAFSKAQSQPTYPCNKKPKSNCTSISSRPRRSASLCHCLCRVAPTR